MQKVEATIQRLLLPIGQDHNRVQTPVVLSRLSIALVEHRNIEVTKGLWKSLGCHWEVDCKKVVPLAGAREVHGDW